MPASGSALRGGNKQSYLVLQCAGLVTPTLLSDQLSNRNIEFQGILTANLAITLGLAYEDAGLAWEFINSCSGAFTLTLQGPTGNVVSLEQGASSQYLWNGTSLVPVESGVGLRPDQTIVTGITGASPTTTLTAAQAANSTIVLQGNPSGTPVVIVPNGKRYYTFLNQLGVGTTVKTAAGTGATVNSGGVQLMYCDGVNMNNVT